jgi:hypothetical protein
LPEGKESGTQSEPAPAWSAQQKGQALKRAVVILDVMWGWGASGSLETALPHFRINPNNFSGRRLHKWLPAAMGWDFVVTNACPELVKTAAGRGKPSLTWLRSNLMSLQTTGPLDLALICGQNAKKTFANCGLSLLPNRLLYLPHPAARFWNMAGIDLVKMVINGSGQSGTIVYNKPNKEFIFNPFKS